MASVLERIGAILRLADGVPLLLLRLYLAPIFIKAGYGKLRLGDPDAAGLSVFAADPGVVSWFRNPDWGLGLPAPELLAALAGWTELLGGCLLVVGLLTRVMSIPLMVTMIVAAVTAHWSNGWHALPESKLTVPWEWRVDLIEEANVRKDAVNRIISEHGKPDYLTSTGPITILKNGIEFAATYFVMLLVLFFYGGGRFLSLDHYLRRFFDSTYRYD